MDDLTLKWVHEATTVLSAAAAVLMLAPPGGIHTSSPPLQTCSTGPLHGSCHACNRPVVLLPAQAGGILFKAWPKFALQFARTEALLLIRASLCRLTPMRQPTTVYEKRKEKRQEKKRGRRVQYREA